MALTIGLAEEFDDEYQAADALERIANLLRAGYTSGIDPAWDMTGEREASDEDGDN